MNKSIAFAAGLAGLLAVQSAAAFTACDSFGKTWELTIMGDTVEGIRDTQDLLGCGGMYVRGLHRDAGFGNYHFMDTSMEGNGNCIAVIWDGMWDTATNTGSGTWYNNNGAGMGSFSMTAGPCAAKAQAAGLAKPDPASIR